MKTIVMDTQKAIQVIDAVSSGIINKTINTSFIDNLIYGKFDSELYRHILDKWKSYKGDFFGFYMSTKDEIKRLILEAFDIEVEPDKYPDYDSRILAQIRDGKNRSEIYPFETEILYQYCLFGYNHSLQVLKDVSFSSWHTVTENKINLYGDYKNWTKFWCRATQEDKELLLNFITGLA